MKLTYVQTEKALESILNTVNILFNAVYKRNVPIFNYDLHAHFDRIKYYIDIVES